MKVQPAVRISKKDDSIEDQSWSDHGTEFFEAPDESPGEALDEFYTNGKVKKKNADKILEQALNFR